MRSQHTNKYLLEVSRRSGVAAREPPLHLVSCKGVLRCLSSVVTACFLLSNVSQVSSGVFVCRFGGPVLGAFSLGLTFGFGSSMAFVSGLASGYFLLARLQSWPSLKNLPVVYVAKNHRWMASGVLPSVMSFVWFDVLLCISRSRTFSLADVILVVVFNRPLCGKGCVLCGGAAVFQPQATLLNLRGVVVWSRWVEPSWSVLGERDGLVGDGGSPQHHGLSLLLMSLLGGWMKECGVNHIYVCRCWFERKQSYNGRLDCGLVGVVGRGSLVMTRDRYWFLRAFDFFQLKF
ncbi:hypothetical protein F2Q70_00026871 [Brassica cretica]|uniref:Uncharacterized protein n=1 Tax=Brassica cretica TaxID=69181 RepID=A0A8S9LC30_BRACR|nr:hypothetical protein F2Q70_00026871 [Brassica cretica]